MKLYTVKIEERDVPDWGKNTYRPIRVKVTNDIVRAKNYLKSYYNGFSCDEDENSLSFKKYYRYDESENIIEITFEEAEVI